MLGPVERECLSRTPPLPGRSMERAAYPFPAARTTRSRVAYPPPPCTSSRAGSLAFRLAGRAYKPKMRTGFPRHWWLVKRTSKHSILRQLLKRERMEVISASSPAPTSHPSSTSLRSIGVTVGAGAGSYGSLGDCNCFATLGADAVTADSGGGAGYGGPASGRGQPIPDSATVSTSGASARGRQFAR